MLENDNEKYFPEAEFTFIEEKKDDLERKKEIERLLEQKNEILASMEKFSIDSSSNINEKMKAGILGFAVGDALGVPIEFTNRENLQKYPVTEMTGFGTYKVPEGTWSDDTSLMLATMDSIREIKDIFFEDIMSKFAEWVNNSKYTATNELFDIGISTKNAINNYIDGNDAMNCGMKGVRDNGNGSLMRILPFVYYLYFHDFNEDEKTLLINYASSLTHAHEISKLGCNIYTDYVTLLLNGVDKIKALELLKNNNYSKYYSKGAIKEYNRILKGDLVECTIDEIKSTGYIVDSLEASLWCTMTNDNYEDAVITAINLGDDTDTIGAITGAINAIIYGIESIPERWLEKLKKKDYIKSLSEEFINILNCQNKDKCI